MPLARMPVPVRVPAPVVTMSAQAARSSGDMSQSTTDTARGRRRIGRALVCVSSVAVIAVDFVLEGVP
jgi:hypothetical protein